MRKAPVNQTKPTGLKKSDSTERMREEVRRGQAARAAMEHEEGELMGRPTVPAFDFYNDFEDVLAE